MAVDLLGPVLTELLTCVRDGLSVPANRLVISPGPPAWDACCEGMAWVRIISMAPGSGVAGNAYRATQSYPCGVLNWAVTVGAGVLRCAAVLDDRGIAPSAAQVTSDALAQTRDASDLSEAIQCCMPSRPGVLKMTMNGWDALGPDGGCVGGEWRFTILAENCQCPG